MRVISLNVNGIRSSANKGLMDKLAEFDADVICLQEVRAQPEQLPPLLPGYQAFWHPAQKPGYSGVGTLVKRAPDQVVIGMGQADIDAEGRILRTDFGDLTIINVYCPSGTSGDVRQTIKMSFLARFLPFLTELAAQGREVLVCGDVNIAHHEIDLKNWRGNVKNSGFLPEERAWVSELLASGYRDVVRELAGPETAIYSWWSNRGGARERDVGWRIDYHLATPGWASKAKAYQIPRLPVLSDHAPVVVDYLAD